MWLTEYWRAWAATRVEHEEGLAPYILAETSIAKRPSAADGRFTLV